MSAAKLTLLNPSPYARGGPIVTPWEPIATAGSFDPKNVTVFYDGRKMPTQVDRLDPDDPSRDELVFSVPELLSTSNEDNYQTESGYATVREGKNDEPVQVWVDQQYTGVKLGNGLLEIWINTDAASPRPDHKNDKWFGGAATSVQLDGHEILDVVGVHGGFGAYGHHHEIRAMQLDRVHLVRPPWNEEGSVDQKLFNRNWRTVSAVAGPVRATATIASDPFDYEYKDAVGKELSFKCSVYRAISLYPGQDWILEEVWLKAIPGGGKKPSLFWFVPGYFMMTEMSFYPDKFRYPNHPGWFVITAPDEENQGYGFATDSLAGAIWHPPLDYPDGRSQHRSFSWELGATRCARCVHLFRRHTNRLGISDAIGKLWYSQAFKPVRAKL
ncbi:MAG TPA: hypothetical protein VJ276_22775 [Thermoanaerobaculia bacterium]|nr:hypothetical protein [Thermoanaerobaculia bacterium]